MRAGASFPAALPLANFAMAKAVVPRSAAPAIATAAATPGVHPLCWEEPDAPFRLFPHSGLRMVREVFREVKRGMAEADRVEVAVGERVRVPEGVAERVEEGVGEEVLLGVPVGVPVGVPLGDTPKVSVAVGEGVLEGVLEKLGEEPIVEVGGGVPVGVAVSVEHVVEPGALPPGQGRQPEGAPTPGKGL